MSGIRSIGGRLTGWRRRAGVLHLPLPRVGVALRYHHHRGPPAGAPRTISAVYIVGKLYRV